MNTKIYKRVFALAGELMLAAQERNQINFDNCYSELKQLCDDNENTDKDHPVQWETLADFTDDLPLAISIYEKALLKAEEINSKDFRSSIGFSVASLQVELGEKENAIENLEKAKISCNKIVDKELKAEIHDLLEALKSEVSSPY
jgi:predicted negative regulator of RcsB-dependent stress response